MLVNKASYFFNSDVLDGVGKEELNFMASVAERVRISRRSSIWNPGEAADAIYFIRTGVAKVSRALGEGREFNLGFRTKGDLIGEECVLGATARHTSAVAYMDIDAYRIPGPEFQRVMSRSQRLTQRVGMLAQQRRRELEQKVGVLLFKTAHARLASMLIELSDTFGVRDGRGTIVNLKLTHKEMAGLIGSTRETVSFAILDLRKSGLLATEGKRVILLDEPALRQLMAA